MAAIAPVRRPGRAGARVTALRWEDPVTLSSPGRRAASPAVAADAAGDVTAVWVCSDGRHDRIVAATRPPGGRWEVPAPPAAALHPVLAEPPVRRAVTALRAWLARLLAR